MDDTCAVCADTLEWVAYGQCGHREVCSTCISRLRFICDDQCCCLCKFKSNIIFVTKALGDYTRVINDFSVFPSDPTEGKVGPYWYHEGTQAFFDDLDHYKMIKATCMLSCIVCDKMDGNQSSKRRGNFRNIEQLKGHLSHFHKLLMCSLCLGGRKIFICEQKLYTREQLNQHINTGDSEVDGSETERGGFKGHPLCQFCRNPFYGENELYTHMSTEHYTCHICQRQHPGHYEYYRNYDELEIHFRTDHFLCEEEGCLTKKFVVFPSESEMKRHNTMEHGGHTSRSKRNAALQIPTSFRFERSIEQDRRRRGHGLHSDRQLSVAVQDSLLTAGDDTSHANSSGAQATGETGDFSLSFRPFELLATSGSEPSSRYSFPRGQTSSNAPLEGSSFPPLPGSTRSRQQKSRKNLKGLGKNTMADRLRVQNTVAVVHSSRASPTADHQSTASMSSSSQLRPTSASGSASSSVSSSSSRSKPAAISIIASQNYSDSAKDRPLTAQGSVSSSSKGSSSITATTGNINHSVSSPNLMNSGKGTFDSSRSNFPPVSATNAIKLTTSRQSLPNIEDARTANKSLVERIRAALQFDEDRYAVFKILTGEYRQGLIETGEYVAYVHQFGLSHLILELARLCPDAKKQKELLDACNTSLVSNVPPELGTGKNTSQLIDKKESKKGKEKLEENGINSSKADLADSILKSARELQSSHKPFMDEVEILSKDGYHSVKGKSKISVIDEQGSSNLIDQLTIENSSQNYSQPTGSSKKVVGGNKPRKKTSKFHRARLGDDSPATILGVTNSDSTPDLSPEKQNLKNGLSEKLPVGGVWRNGGGRKLVAKLR